MRHRDVCLFVAMLSVSACNSEAPVDKSQAADKRPPAAPASTTASAPDVEDTKKNSSSLAVEAEGLRLFDKFSGSARPIGFGTPRKDVLDLLGSRGKPTTGTNSECGAGRLDYVNWPDGLGLFFQNDKFVGWNLSGNGDAEVTTASGVGPGRTRSDLEAAYAADITQTTLGTEFSAGGLFGLLEGDSKTAKITYMWGGVSCNFR